MHLKDFFPFSSLVIFLLISILSHAFPKYVCAIDFRYAACNSTVKCGRLGNIQYPFWVKGIQPTYCGHPWFELDCQNDEAFWSEKQFRVLDLDNRTRTLKIARFNDPSTGRIACPYYFNITEDLISIFRYTSNVTMIRVLHGCLLIKDLSSYEYPCNNQSHSYFVANESLAKKYLSSCGYNFLLPFPRSAAEGLRNGSLRVGEALVKEYELKWTVNETQCEECRESGGRCGYDLNFNTPSCFCRDKPHQQTCTSSSKYPSLFVFH